MTATRITSGELLKQRNDICAVSLGARMVRSADRFSMTAEVKTNDAALAYEIGRLRIPVRPGTTKGMDQDQRRRVDADVVVGNQWHWRLKALVNGSTRRDRRKL